MRLLVAKGPLRRILRWTRRVLFAGGVSLLAYCAYVLVDARDFQQGQRHQLDRLLANRRQAGGSLRQTASPPLSGPLPLAAGAGLFGRLEIPRLGLSVMVLEGTSAKTLRQAVGHVAGTALPGMLGNVGISGHRDTFFRPLRNIRQNDVIMLTTQNGEYRYRVESTEVVSPSDVAVLDGSASEVLTLVTCFPFYFVGPASRRFIVRAVRIT